MFNLSESEIHYAAPGFCAVRQLPVFHAPIDTKIPQAERRSASDRKQEEKNKDMDDWAHEKAAGIAQALTQSEDGEHPLDNSDNFMAWQTLLYWYNKSGFDDVTNVINK